MVAAAVQAPGLRSGRCGGVRQMFQITQADEISSAPDA